MKSRNLLLLAVLCLSVGCASHRVRFNGGNGCSVAGPSCVSEIWMLAAPLSVSACEPQGWFYKKSAHQDFVRFKCPLRDPGYIELVDVDLQPAFLNAGPGLRADPAFSVILRRKRVSTASFLDNLGAAIGEAMFGGGR